jgi:triacylglycerol lipase
MKLIKKSFLSSLLMQFILFGCVSASKIVTSVQEEKILRYPVVLVHGIAFRDTSYWGNIPEFLRAQGVDVYFGDTDAWGNFETNAVLLKASIENILETSGKEKVNIIAHSKGGLDSRYLIWKHDFGGRIASLTTISTPHHGAEAADLVYGLKSFHKAPAANILKNVSSIYGDIYPNIYAAIAGLTTENMKHFNETVLNDNRVYYQSMYTSLQDSMDDPFCFYTHKYIQEKSGDNDGLVSEKSAQWGDNYGKIPGSLSHFDIIDVKKQTIRGIKIPLIYLDIVHGLAEMGF